MSMDGEGNVKTGLLELNFAVNLNTNFSYGLSLAWCYHSLIYALDTLQYVTTGLLTVYPFSMMNFRIMDKLAQAICEHVFGSHAIASNFSRSNTFKA